MSAAGDRLQAQIKLAAEQQSNGYRSVVYGHIASYDPKTSRARWIIPSFTDDGEDFVLTSWAPLATGFNGAGWGIQAAPVGGATKQKPTAGELCLLNMSERQYGTVIGGHVVANQVNTPPNPSLAPGEIYMKGKAGQTVHMDAAGNVSIAGSANISITVGGVSFVVSSNGVAISGGVVTHNGKNIGSTHLHSGIIVGGDDTGPPV